MLAFFRLIRLGNLAIIALSLSLFYYLILVPAHRYKMFTALVPFTPFDFVLFLLSVILVAAAGNIINDYFDFQLDKAHKPNRPLAQGYLTLDAALYLHAVLAFSGIGLGFYLGWQANNYKIGYLYVIAVLLLYLYSAYLKKIPLAGNVVVSGLTGFVFVLLMIFEATFLNVITFQEGPFVLQLLLWQVKFYGGFAFLTNLAREVVKDLEDMEGDEAFNVTTLPVQFGETAGKITAALIILSTVTFMGYFIKLFFDGGRTKEIAYLATTVCLPLLAAVVNLFKAKSKEQYAQVSLLLKVVMLLGILSIPVFYWFNK